MKSHWENYCKGKAEAGAEANVADWRVARAICVLDDDKMAARYGRDDPNSPYRFYYEQMRAKMKRGKRLYVFKSHKEQPDEEITHDYVMEHCVIHGGVSKVVDQILALREEIGDFGELVYAGMDWAEPALNKRFDAIDGRGGHAARVNAAIGDPPPRPDREPGVTRPRVGKPLIRDLSCPGRAERSGSAGAPDGQAAVRPRRAPGSGR